MSDDGLTIELPNEWAPRDYQTPLWRYMEPEEAGLRAIAIWHRRAGKDSEALNITCAKAHKRIGTYWHMLPEKEQARKAIWNGLDKQGRRIIDQVFPKEIRVKTVDDEMRIELKCGSHWQVVGSDSYNSLVGTNPVGVVFSEYSVGNPAAWDYIRPILLENGGWAIFAYTPRGKNHGHKLYEMARKNPKWFTQLLTVEDTLIVPPSAIEEERESGMDDDMIQQEYFCSFSGVMVGAIYGEQMAKARKEGRITKLGYDRRFPVHTFWDIGHRDAASVVFHQDVGGSHRFIRSYSAAGQDIGHFIFELQRLGHVEGYRYGKHHFPHDVKTVTQASKSNQNGDNIWKQAITAGLREEDMVQVPRTQDIWVAIAGVRAQFATASFDEENAAGLINSLESYKKKYDEERKCYLNVPYHDWASNDADAFRQWAQGYNPTAGIKKFTPPAPLPMRVTLPPQSKTIAQKRAGY